MLLQTLEREREHQRGNCPCFVLKRIPRFVMAQPGIDVFARNEELRKTAPEGLINRLLLPLLWRSQCERVDSGRLGAAIMPRPSYGNDCIARLFAISGFSRPKN
jgi:hypothetical protein